MPEGRGCRKPPAQVPSGGRHSLAKPGARTPRSARRDVRGTASAPSSRPIDGNRVPVPAAFRSGTGRLGQVGRRPSGNSVVYVTNHSATRASEVHMSGEQQLERSVLDGKERDELLAIAEAMGLKPAARVTKSTLVTQILRATGVEVEEGNGAKRRRRGRERDRGERDLPGMGQEQQFTGEPVPVQGLLDLRDEGFGFLRTTGYLSSPKDVYVSISQVRRFALRKGDYVEGASRPAGSNEKYPALLRIDTVSGMTPDDARLRPRFEDLTPLFPDEKLRLEVPGDSANVTARI